MNHYRACAGVAEWMCVWNAITKLELKVGLAKAKSGSGAYIGKVMGIKRNIVTVYVEVEVT